MKIKPFIIVLFSLLLTSSCIPATTSAPTQEISGTEPAPATPTSEIVPTSPSKPELEPVISAVASPYVPFYVVTNVDNLVLRANPGPLFEAKTTLPNASRLLVLGRAPGSEWLFVQTPLERTGWVFSQYVTSEGNLKLAPFIQPADMQLVLGRVLDENGKPVSGIQFAVVQAKAGSPPRIDAITDETGTFYAFVPVNTTGSWEISFTAIACTSPLMDKDCKCLNGVCGGPTPTSVSVTLPLDKSLEFVWK